jgi:hypothetical protein
MELINNNNIELFYDYINKGKILQENIYNNYMKNYKEIYYNKKNNDYDQCYKEQRLRTLYFINIISKAYLNTSHK